MTTQNARICRKCGRADKHTHTPDEVMAYELVRVHVEDDTVLADLEQSIEEALAQARAEERERLAQRAEVMCHAESPDSSHGACPEFGGPCVVAEHIRSF